MRAPRLIGLFATLALLYLARPARAQSTSVVLLRPPSVGGRGTEILNRARGELVADGFYVLPTREVPDSADCAQAAAQAGREAGAAVTAGFLVGDNPAEIELCLVDGLTGRIITKRIDAAPDSPEVLTRRTVDLLRASLLDFLVESVRTAIARPPPVVVAAPTPTPLETAEPSRWAVEVGLGSVIGFAGVDPAVVALARVRFALNSIFLFRITGAGLGTQPRVYSPSGSATVEQDMGLVEVLAQFGHEHSIRPHASIGAGTYYVGVSGDGVAPNPGQHDGGFALALDTGLGAGLPVGGHLEVVIEAHAIVTEPGFTIAFPDRNAPKLGRPSLFGTITLAGWI